jgi:hypothetical protein
MGFGVVVVGVELELQNQGQKHFEPLAKLGAEGIEEWVARTPATRCGMKKRNSEGSAPANGHTEIRPQPTWGSGHLWHRPWRHHRAVSVVTSEMASVWDRVPLVKAVLTH